MRINVKEIIPKGGREEREEKRRRERKKRGEGVEREDRLIRF